MKYHAGVIKYFRISHYCRANIPFVGGGCQMIQSQRCHGDCSSANSIGNASTVSDAEEDGDDSNKADIVTDRGNTGGGSN